MEKHPLEASDSWKVFLDKKDSKITSNGSIRRNLRHEDSQERRNGQEMLMLEQEEEDAYWEKQQDKRSKEEAKRLRKEQKHIAKVKKLYRNPGIAETTVHGLMVSCFQFHLSVHNLALVENLFTLPN
jgi:carboxylesterase type B